MPPKKRKKAYGPGGQYYRQRITRPDGRTEDVYGRTLPELAEKVQRRKTELVAGSVPPKEMYVYEYAAAWYARRAPHLSEGQRKSYAYQVNNIICPVIGGKPMAEITKDDLLDVLATRAHLSRRTQKDTVMVLKQLFSAAADADVIPKDPSVKIKAGGEAPAPKAALTDAQQAALLEAVRGLKVEPFVMLGLYTGMRRGEICGLRWDCVHLDGDAPYIEVRRGCRWPDAHKPEVSDELKTAAARRDIPIPPQLVQYLHGLRAAQMKKLRGSEAAKLEKLRELYVYCDDKGGPVSYTAFRRRWETIRTRSTASGRRLGEKIPKHRMTVTLDTMPTPHTLRHTYVTRLVLSGMDLKRVQYLAGHSSPDITLRIYTSLQKATPAELAAGVLAAFEPAK